MLWRLGQAIGIDLIDRSQFQSGKEKVSLYPLPDEDNVPIRKTPDWTWLVGMSVPTACSPDGGEELISGYVVGIAQELEEIMQEMGFKVSNLK